jgi:hypothetical protein
MEGGSREILGYGKDIRRLQWGSCWAVDDLPSPITLVTRQSMPSPSRVRDLLLR